MRILLTFLVIFICRQTTWGQQDKTLTERSHMENFKEFTNNVFKYPEFVAGKVILKDSSVIAAKLNYNRVLGQILSISRQGKTVPFEHPETFNKIIIASDTFQYYNKGFLEKFTHYQNGNLYIKQTIRYIEKVNNENNGSIYIPTNSSKLPYTNDDHAKPGAVVIGENAEFKFINEYFLADKLMNIYPATKKGFFDLFPMYKNELKTYLREHSVNFNKIDQMEKLLQYLQGL